jgi:hypothetical protein
MPLRRAVKGLELQRGSCAPPSFTLLPTPCASKFAILEE